MAVRSLKITFEGSQGAALAARIDEPEAPTRTTALFAHCFTCSKDSAAASRISRALAELGVCVLRFDFTGLGGSDGEFENTSFSSNIEDLVKAADFLRERFSAPKILVGHSLGGAAILAAASRIPEVEAVATINAPLDPGHVKHLFTSSEDEIDEHGYADVDIAGRTFRVTKQFLEDIDEHRASEYIRLLRRALLVFHSPEDAIVDVENARRIYDAARHPKSFVSLPGANHLLTNKHDAQYVAHVLAAWASRYVSTLSTSPPRELGVSSKDAASDAHEQNVVVVSERREGRYQQDIIAGRHHLSADEPTTLGGDDTGPSPYALLMAALGACTSMTLRMYANHKRLNLSHVRVKLSHQKVHAEDCQDCESKQGRIDVIEREIEVAGELSDAQRERLLEIANKCPVHKTLHSEVRVRSKLAQLDEATNAERK